MLSLEEVHAMFLKDYYQKMINDPENADIMNITPDVEIARPVPVNYGAEFEAAMIAKDITVLDKYEKATVKVRLSCDICNNVWSEQPTIAKKIGCPVCRKAMFLILKEEKLWNRSKKIIKDKRGAIVKIPEKKPGGRATVNDEFVVQCLYGHNFTTTHTKLALDKWCPVRECPSRANKLKSSAVYQKNHSKADNFARLKQMAILKGSTIIDDYYTVGYGQHIKYRLLCDSCNQETLLTVEQIRKNIYLCHNQCTKGNRYSYFQIDEMMKEQNI